MRNAFQQFFARPSVAAYIEVQVHNVVHLAISIDQLARMVFALLVGRRGWSDETLSAYAWRAAVDGKLAARAMRRLIDALFAWQAADPAITDDAGKPIESHCHRAFVRERLKQYLPPEYRKDPTARRLP